MENYDELFRKMVAVLVGCVLCWLIGHLFASCSPGRQVTGSSSHRVDTVYAVKTVRDTARVTDSVVVMVSAKGDTVYKTKEVWRERERVRWRKSQLQIAEEEGKSGTRAAYGREKN